MCFRDRSHHVEDLPGPLLVHDGKVEVGAARIRGLLVRPAELAGKQAAGKRTPHEQADLFGFQQGNDFPFEIAAGDRVISLKRVESGRFLNSEIPRALAIFHACQLEQPM